MLQHSAKTAFSLKVLQHSSKTDIEVVTLKFYIPFPNTITWNSHRDVRVNRSAPMIDSEGGLAKMEKIFTGALM